MAKMTRKKYHTPHGANWVIGAVGCFGKILVLIVVLVVLAFGIQGFIALAIIGAVLMMIGSIIGNTIQTINQK